MQDLQFLSVRRKIDGAYPFLMTMLAIVLSSMVLNAEVPRMISYQGRIAVGDPAINFDGAGQFKFALVNGAGDRSYWSNDGTSVGGLEPDTAITLPVHQGLYSVLLGNTAPPFEMPPITPEAIDHPDVRLRIWFDDGLNGSQLLSPDQRIVSVGYALVAGGLAPDATVPGLEDALMVDSPQALTRQQRKNLAAAWPEAAGSRVAPIGAIGDGSSHPCSERFDTLEEAQALWPHVENLSDEQDWAAIQAALDSLNQVEGEETGGIVFLPAGDYVINRTLKIRGPGVTLQGAGKLQTYLRFTNLTGTALRLAFADESDFNTKGQSGSPRNVTLRDFKFVHEDPTNSGNNSVGFTTRTPLGGADFWYVIYLTLERVDLEGFDIAAEFSNVPICVLRDCSITGKTRSVRLYKIDSLTAINCDLNGTYIPRNGTGNGQIDFPNNVNIEAISALPSDMTSDGLFSGGGPNGAGFYLQIIGGELGHGRAVMINGGLPTRIVGSNIEDITNDWAFRLTGPCSLILDTARLELRSTVDRGFSSMDSVFLIDAGVGTGLKPQLDLRNCKFPGWPSDKPHTIVKGNVTESGRVGVKQDRGYRISWRDSANVEYSTSERAGRNLDRGRITYSVSDTPVGNVSLFGGPAWYPRFRGFPEDLLSPYKLASGETYRSSLLNHRLIQTFSSLQATRRSSAGDTGLFTDPILHQGTIPAERVYDEGDKVVIEASGYFADNANIKGIKFLLGWDAEPQFQGEDDFFGEIAGTWQDKSWFAAVTAVRQTDRRYVVTTRIFIDGENPIVQSRVINVLLDQETRWRILPTGSAAGDVELQSFILKYEQGTSNR